MGQKGFIYCIDIVTYINTRHKSCDDARARAFLVIVDESFVQSYYINDDLIKQIVDFAQLLRQK